MKLSKMKASDFSAKLKVTIQKTGKLGFSGFTASQLGLDTNTYVSIYKDDDAPKSPILVCTKQESKEAFRAHESNGYFSLSTSALFDKLGFDYKTSNIICDLKREPAADEFVEGEAYRLVARQEKKKRAQQPDLFDNMTSDK